MTDGAGVILYTHLVRVLAAALVDQDLIGKGFCLLGVFGEVEIELLADKVLQRLVNKGVGDRLFCLILIGGHGGKAVDHKEQAIPNVLKDNTFFALLSLLPLKRRNNVNNATK